MLSLAVALVALSAGLYAPAELPTASPPAPGIELRYDRPLGQLARYRTSLEVTGTQVSLGERLPVKWKADAELSEEVVAKASDGSLWLRVTGRLADVTGANGAFANGTGAGWPEVRLRLSPRGELLEAAQVARQGDPRARERAFAALMGEFTPIVLPDRPVRPGDEWQVEVGAARQTNRLISLQGRGDSQIARIASVASWPLALDEVVAELGLETHLTGEARQSSELELLPETGLVRRHTGRAHIVTSSSVSLSLPEGPQLFAMESDLTVAFDVRLIAVDGRPVGSR